MQLERGYVYHFSYNAKWKEKLPIWDKRPLVYVLSVDNRFCLGINLHWLPTNKDKVKFVQYLTNASKRIKNKKIFIRWTWKILMAYGHTKKMAKEAIRLYIKRRIRNVKLVPRNELNTYSIAIKWKAKKVPGGKI